MSAKIERFELMGSRFGIEDYQDGRPPSEHFFASDTKDRYRLWADGCSIGTTNVLTRARSDLRIYATARVHEKLVAAQRTVRECRAALQWLATQDPIYTRGE